MSPMEKNNMPRCDLCHHISCDITVVCVDGRDKALCRSCRTEVGPVPERIRPGQMEAALMRGDDTPEPKREPEKAMLDGDVLLAPIDSQLEVLAEFDRAASAAKAKGMRREAAYLTQAAAQYAEALSYICKVTQAAGSGRKLPRSPFSRPAAPPRAVAKVASKAGRL